MEIRALETLLTVDDFVSRFTPLGLDTGRKLRPEAAARFVQRLIADCDLAPCVPEIVRNSFEKARSLHVRGLFEPILFTEAFHSAHMTFETALGARFVEFYGGRLPMIHATTGAHQQLEVQGYEEVSRALRGQHAKQSGWYLERHSGFDGSLASLIRWARTEGLLYGQQNRVHEQILRRFRNLAAHSHQPFSIFLKESAGAIRDMSELINHLWGQDTGQGRLYGMPEVGRYAKGRHANGSTTTLPADELRSLSDLERPGKWSVVESTWDDVTYWRPGFETTTYPTSTVCVDLEWHDARRAYEKYAERHESRIAPRWHDRIFLIRTAAGNWECCRNPSQFRSLPLEDRDRAGWNWQIARADTPDDALEFICRRLGLSVDLSPTNREALRRELGVDPESCEGLGTYPTWVAAKNKLDRLGQ